MCIIISHLPDKCRYLKGSAYCMIDESKDAGVPTPDDSHGDPDVNGGTPHNDQHDDEGGQSQESQAAQMEKLIHDLVQMSPEERDATLSDVPHQQKQMILSLVEQQQRLVEGARERYKSAEHEAEKGNTDEALHFLDPTASPEKRSAFQFAIDNTRDKEAVGEDIKIEMLEKWRLAGTTKDEAKNFINTNTTLSDPEKEDMRNRIDTSELPEMDLSDDDKEVPKNERDQMRANGDAMNKSLEEFNTNIDSQLTDEEHPPSDEEREQLLATKGKIASLYEKISDFFGEDESGRIWARRTGKFLYFSLVIIFLAILLEMTLINKAAGKRGR
jgi:hypothetical protein